MQTMQQKLRKALRVAVGAITSGGSQNFLGARWVPALLRWTPSRIRTDVALLLLSLSPHYFFDKDRRAEAERNRKSRETLVRDLLVPFLDQHAVALDYGCGPGWMAAAVAPRIKFLEAVDISRGVLACAQVLNGAPNIIYETPEEASGRSELVDLVYSFAVVQHLTDETFRAVLSLVRLRLRPGGTLLIHFTPPTAGWRTEAQWRGDTSIKGRAKLRFAMNCFARGMDDVESLVAEAGFSEIRIEPLAAKTDVEDDISRQYWLVASG
jgi:SAM-dependent methyltransferase